MKNSNAASGASNRFLEGVVVGISISYGEDSEKSGFSELEMNRAVVSLSDGLLAAGAKLVFGHDWRPNGIMVAIADLAVRYEPAATSNENGRPAECRITNLVPWDSRPELPSTLRKDLEARRILRVIEVGLPEPLPDHFPQSSKRGLRAAALCVLRQRLTEVCDARICLGGKFDKYEGFWPGILEEAWRGVVKGQPVYLSRILRGASGRILDASRSGDWRELTAGTSNTELRQELSLFKESRTIDLPDFSQAGVLMSPDQLQRYSWLDREDWERLMNATDIEVVTALVLKGLRQRRQHSG